MMIFPTLSTGAVAQYPLPLTYVSPVQAIRFIDGTDQRFAMYAKALRNWRIDLESLSDAEIAQLESFFESVEGQYSLFAFPDPYSGQLVPNCRVGEFSLITEYLAFNLSSASIWVVESNG